MKYRNHPSINIIWHFSQRYSSFYFSQVEKNTVLKEIRRLSSKKAVQKTDIPVKILKKMQNFLLNISVINSTKPYVHQNFLQLSNLQM